MGGTFATVSNEVTDRASSGVLPVIGAGAGKRVCVGRRADGPLGYDFPLHVFELHFELSDEIPQRCLRTLRVTQILLGGVKTAQQALSIVF
ncbi:MAG: hypothetical protein LKF88_05780 [Microbacteriaceae bacterium]|jgi:hypothetical protein|nr:hypothetical protein [Microbacteriaceae bacterium]